MANLAWWKVGSGRDELQVTPQEIVSSVASGGADFQVAEVTISNKSAHRIDLVGAKLGCFVTGECFKCNDAFPMTIAPRTQMRHQFQYHANAKASVIVYELYFTGRQTFSAPIRIRYMQ